MQKWICYVILESHRPRNGSLMFVHEGSKVCAACPEITDSWLCSTPRLFVRATCGRGGGSPHHLGTSLRYSMGNEILVLSTCCHRMPILELWVQHCLACLHAMEKLYEQLISLPYRQLLSVRYSTSPSSRGPLSTWVFGASLHWRWFYDTDFMCFEKIKLTPFPLCPFLMMISHSFKK